MMQKINIKKSCDTVQQLLFVTVITFKFSLQPSRDYQPRGTPMTDNADIILTISNMIHAEHIADHFKERMSAVASQHYSIL